MRWAVAVVLLVMAVPAFGQDNTDILKKLSVEQARTLVATDGRGNPLSLKGLTTLTPEVAEALAKHKGRLSLNGLTTLSPEVAEALATHNGELLLDGLTTLSPKVADALAKHNGGLFLKGLKTLSPEVAEALATHNAVLVLEGLTTLSIGVAKALAEHKGTLGLERLTTLSPEVAGALAEHGGELFLNGLTTLSPEAAEALAKHKGRLVLSGLTTLSPELAEALATHEGGLSLNGLTTLSPEAAEALAKHKGQLYLKGLTTISPEVAETLAESSWELFLSDSENLTPECRTALSKSKGLVVIDYLPLTPHFTVDDGWRIGSSEDFVSRAVEAAIGREVDTEEPRSLGGISLGMPLRELWGGAEAIRGMNGNYSALLIPPREHEAAPNEILTFRADGLSGRVVGITKSLEATALSEVVDSIIERFGKTDQEIVKDTIQNGPTLSSRVTARYAYKNTVGRVVSHTVNTARRWGGSSESVHVSLFDREWVEGNLLAYGHAVDRGCEWMKESMAAFDGATATVAEIAALPGTERKASPEGANAFFVDIEKGQWRQNSAHITYNNNVEGEWGVPPSVIVAAAGTAHEDSDEYAIIAFMPLRSSGIGLRHLMSVRPYIGENDITVTAVGDLFTDVASPIVQRLLPPITDKISVITPKVAESVTLGQAINVDGGVREINAMFRNSRQNRLEWRTKEGWLIRVCFDGSILAIRGKGAKKSFD